MPAASASSSTSRAAVRTPLSSRGCAILVNLLHRGACGCEAATGDGAGILVQMPDRFLRKVTAPLGFTLPAAGGYGAGFVFLPHAEAAREEIRALFESIVREEGQQVLGWRLVPTDDRLLGASAVAVEPRFEQIFIGAGSGFDPTPGTMSGTRGRASSASCTSSASASSTRSIGCPDRSASAFYIPSLSANTLIYKGMLIADQIVPMFPDLADPDFESALALVHQRFSTNTFPSWPLAHPYRYIAHNGEINTLRGNINWMRAREGLLTSPLLGEDLKKILPIIREGGSDTATFDNVLEFLVMTGPIAAARDPDDDPRALGRARIDVRRAQGLLRVPLVADGAVGRPGLDCVHRRLRHRRGPRPQRPPSVALLRDEGRPRDHGVRGRRARHSAREHPDQGAAASGPHFSHRHGPGPHRLRRGDQARPGARAAVRGMAQGKPGRHRGSAGGAVPAASQPRDRAARQQTFGYTDEDLRAAARADGREGRRSGRLDGQRRGARGALGSPAPAVRLLHPGVRAGHQPAARRHPRAAGDGDGIDDRSRRATCSIRVPSRATRSRSSIR